MRRRAFITLLGGAAAACPLAARAQQGERVRRIGVLIGVTDNEEGLARLGAFRRGLQALDWTEGRNVQLVVRFGESDPARIHAYATELVTLAPDVILANTNPAARALRDVTQTIPIVFSQLIDPVADGLVSNLAHPGGNLTGFTSFEYAMGGKWLEALKEIAPGLTRVLVIVGGAPQNVIAGFSTVIETAASQYRMQITQANVISSADIERAIQAFTHEPNGGLILLPTPVATVHLELFIALCALHRLPAIYPYRYFVARGGLLAYGFDNLDLFRRAASYVDRILKGANAGELPVQNPTKYELVINLKTAKALGLEIPPTLLARARGDRMRRREFITLLGGGAVAWPLTARAQQPTAPQVRVGLITPTPLTPAMLSAFRDGMHERGYVEGQNLSIAVRWPKGPFEQNPGLVAELVSGNVDVLVAWATPSVIAARRATSTIPIVMVSIGDPLGSGFVASLARPGGNITGVSNITVDLSAKLVGLLIELVPGMKRVGVVHNPFNPNATMQLRQTEDIVRKLGLLVHVVEARTSEEYERAFAHLSAESVKGVVILADPSVIEQRLRIAEVALAARLPTAFQLRENVEAGGLLSYGANINSQFHLAAFYVDRILRGAKPADLPVQEPTKIELVINLKTAKALGLDVPPQLLATADEVIE